jgi:hypothetical protein
MNAFIRLIVHLRNKIFIAFTGKMLVSEKRKMYVANAEPGNAVDFNAKTAFSQVFRSVLQL